MFILPTDNWLILKTENFELKLKQKREVQRTLAPLIEVSPCLSSFVLEVEKKGLFFYGNLKINTVVHNFVVWGKGESLVSLSCELRKSMIYKIKDWKKYRVFSLAV